MKKPFVIMVVALCFTVSSCGSSWNCKKRYADTDKDQNKTTVVENNNDTA